MVSWLMLWRAVIKTQWQSFSIYFLFFNLEKKDLVELVLQHSQVSSPLDATDSQSSRLSSSESYTDNGIRVSDQVRDDRPFDQFDM